MGRTREKRSRNPEAHTKKRIRPQALQRFFLAGLLAVCCMCVAPVLLHAGSAPEPVPPATNVKQKTRIKVAHLDPEKIIYHIKEARVTGDDPFFTNMLIVKYHKSMQEELEDTFSVVGKATEVSDESLKDIHSELEIGNFVCCRVNEQAFLVTNTRDEIRAGRLSFLLYNADVCSNTQEYLPLTRRHKLEHTAMPDDEELPTQDSCDSPPNEPYK